jgi:hypothetical protein
VGAHDLSNVQRGSCHHGTRFGSSNCADVFAALCSNRLSQMPFGLGTWGLRKHHHPNSESICSVTTRSTPEFLRWIEAETECPVVVAEAVAAQLSTAQHALGQPANRSTADHVFIGMSAVTGVAVMVGTVGMIITVRDV